MSYDLYLDRSQALTLEDFTAFFSSLPHFKVTGRQAFYANEDSGVYFSFDYNEAVEGSEQENPKHLIAFNLNYYRPSMFGLEAAPILTQVVDHFGFSITDPQNEGMGEGPFSSEGFLRGWNAGNKFGYRAILGSENRPDVIYAKPAKELHDIWKWNLNRNTLQATFGEDIFVPRIFWILQEGRACSSAVWPDGISSLLPQTDFYYVPRKQLAPLRWFRRDDKTCIISRHQLTQAGIGTFKDHGYSLPCHKFEEKTPSQPTIRFVKSLKSPAKLPQTIAIDSVLDQELVDENIAPKC